MPTPIPTQLLVNVLQVTVPASGNLLVTHGLRDNDLPVAPTFIIPNRTTPVYVDATAVNSLTAKLVNPNTSPETLWVRFERGLSMELDALTVNPFFWAGGGSAGPSGVTLVSGTAPIRVVNGATTPVVSLDYSANFILTGSNLDLANAGTPGLYGSQSSVPQFTTDSKGRVVAVTDIPIQIAESQVTNLITDLGNKANSSVSIIVGTGMTGGGPLTANVNIGLSFGNSAGTVCAGDDPRLSDSRTPTGAASGDLSGFYPGPTVARVKGTAVTTAGGALTTGAVLRVTGPAAADWGALDLGNSSAVTGTLPAGNQAAQTLAGDVTGTTAAASVVALRGTSISTQVPLNGQALVLVGGTWTPVTISGGGGGGGGGGFTYYFNYSVTPVVDPPPGGGSQLSLDFDDVTPSTNTGAITLPQDTDPTPFVTLAQFVTDLGDPGATTIPPGIWEVGFYAYASVATGAYLRATLSKWDGGTLTPLVVSQTQEVTHAGPSPELFSCDFYVPATVLTGSDRLVVTLEGQKDVAAARTLTVFFEGNTVSHVHTTFGAPGGTGLVKVVNGVVQDPASLLFNSDVASNAAIDVSKLAAGTNGYILTTVAGVPTWAANTGGGGSVTSVSSTNAFLTVVNGTTTPSLTVNVGTTGTTVAVGDDARFNTSPGATGAVAYDTGTAWSKTLSPGDSNRFLRANPSGAPTWDNVNLGTNDVTGTLTGSKGGTGQSSYVKGDMLYAAATGSVLSPLGIGALGHVLTVSASGLPSWAAPSAGITSVTGTGNIAASTVGSAVTVSFTGVLPVANGGTGLSTVGSNGQVLTVVAGAPAWATPPSGSVTSVDVSGGTTGLTTSGGPVTTSGIITIGGTLVGANGGTGFSSYAEGDLLYAAAAGSALSKRAIGSSGQFFVVSGGLPTWANPAAGGILGYTGSTYPNPTGLRGDVPLLPATPGTDFSFVADDETGIGSTTDATGITLAAGSVTGVAATGAGGDIDIQAGYSTGGDGGNVRISSGAGVQAGGIYLDVSAGFLAGGVIALGTTNNNLAYVQLSRQIANDSYGYVYTNGKKRDGKSSLTLSTSVVGSNTISTTQLGASDLTAPVVKVTWAAASNVLWQAAATINTGFSDGTVVRIFNNNATYELTLYTDSARGGSLAGTKLILGTSTRTLAPYGSIDLMLDTVTGYWTEVAFSPSSNPAGSTGGAVFGAYRRVPTSPIAPPTIITSDVFPGDYILNLADNNDYVITLPTAVGQTGRALIVKVNGTGTITINTTSSQTIDGSTTISLTTQYTSYTFVSDGANWMIV